MHACMGKILAAAPKPRRSHRLQPTKTALTARRAAMLVPTVQRHCPNLAAARLSRHREEPHAPPDGMLQLVLAGSLAGRGWRRARRRRRSCRWCGSLGATGMLVRCCDQVALLTAAFLSPAEPQAPCCRLAWQGTPALQVAMRQEVGSRDAGGRQQGCWDVIAAACSNKVGSPNWPCFARRGKHDGRPTRLVAAIDMHCSPSFILHHSCTCSHAQKRCSGHTPAGYRMALQRSGQRGQLGELEFELCERHAAPLLVAGGSSSSSRRRAGKQHRRQQVLPFASVTMQSGSGPLAGAKRAPAFMVASAAEGPQLDLTGVPQWRITAGNLAAGATAGCAVEAGAFCCDVCRDTMEGLRL